MGKLEKSKTITLKPVEVTKELMETLEERKLISRLGPKNHRPDAVSGEFAVKCLYASAETYGPHSLCAVTVDQNVVDLIETHPDSEDWFLIGDPQSRPLYVVFSLDKGVNLQKKIAAKTLSDADFILVKMKFNDPEVSFFSIPKDVPHRAVAAQGDGVPPSLYVTLSKNLPLDTIDLGDYRFQISD